MSMRRLRNKNTLIALSWLAILLAATASADVVEDLVFEPFEAEAAESSLPQQDLEDPAENATLRSLGGSVPDVKTSGPVVSVVGSAGGLEALSSMRLPFERLVRTCDYTPLSSSTGLLPPLRI